MSSSDQGNNISTLCPICAGRMDSTDQQFEPCPCGYKMCAFCYNQIVNDNNPSCPACRSKYDLSNIIQRPSNHTLSNNNSNHSQSRATNRSKTKKQRTLNGHSNHNGHHSSNHRHSHQIDDEPHHSTLSYDELSNIRVRQRNLVYVVGLPIHNVDEQTLKTNKWFGRFG